MGKRLLGTAVLGLGILIGYLAASARIANSSTASPVAANQTVPEFSITQANVVACAGSTVENPTAEHRLHARGQPGLRRIRLLWRRHPARGCHAADRPAGRRGTSAAQLQRRSAMHAEPIGAHDRPASDALRHHARQSRRRSLWPDPVGNHPGRSAFAARLRHRPFRQVAPGRNRRPLSHEPGLRRMVRHPELDLRKHLDRRNWLRSESQQGAAHPRRQERREDRARSRSTI